MAAAGLSYAAYTATYWRVNPQYLVPTVALALLLAGRAGRPSVKALSGAVALLAGLWPLMYPVSFWAHVHIPSPNRLVVKALEHASLNILSDLAYVYYSLALTLAQLLLAVETMRWTLRRRPWE
ncbi:hypothetical protein [Stetteria hydrogenophila]